MSRSKSSRSAAALAVCAAALLLAAQPANADIYMHNPRGSNNRNCRSDNGETRRNDKRLFDSENNDKGGYSCPLAWPFDCYKYYKKDYGKLLECQAINSDLTDEELKASIDSDGVLLTEGAVNTPRMYYHSGSTLQVEWTVQHGFGPNDELHSNVVLQYACEDTLTDNCGLSSASDPLRSPFYPDTNISERCTLRDGRPVALNHADVVLNVEANKQISESTTDLSTQDDQRYGRHETLSYFTQCERRSRNKGLYAADQNVNNGRGARATRQDPTGNDRYGLECPEEAHYWPYWHWSPWKDIAVLVESDAKCDWFRAESQNVKPRGRCVCPIGQCTSGGSQPSTQGACNVAGYTWVEDPSHNLPPPDCQVAQFNRQNHLGNVGTSTHTNAYTWTLPSVSSPQRCVLRARYNISTFDFESVSESGTAANNQAASPLYDNDNNEALTYVAMEGLDAPGAALGFAINTNQYGRTFQDRSYVFELRPAPSSGDCEGVQIHNLNVRGKRGNIVQTYPSVEYDFVPTQLTVAEDECVHVQWVGSDYNPDRNGNNGEGGPYAPNNLNNNTQETKADRHNIAQLALPGDNFPMTSLSQFTMFTASRETWQRLVMLDQPFSDPEVCWSYEKLAEFFNDRASREESDNNCMKLSQQKTPYFNAGLVRPGAVGTYSYMSTRNNNFSNRGQKGKLVVVPAGLSAAAIAGIAIGTIAFLAAGVFGVRRYRQRRAAGGGAGGAAVLSAKSGGYEAPQAAARPASGRGISGLVAGFGALTARWTGGAGAAGAAGESGFAVATYAHQAQEAGELSFSKGDRIRVISRDVSGWWEGELNGERGIFPANYVKH